MEKNCSFREIFPSKQSKPVLVKDCCVFTIFKRELPSYAARASKAYVFLVQKIVQKVTQYVIDRKKVIFINFAKSYLLWKSNFTAEIFGAKIQKS